MVIIARRSGEFAHPRIYASNHTLMVALVYVQWSSLSLKFKKKKFSQKTLVHFLAMLLLHTRLWSYAVTVYCREMPPEPSSLCLNYYSDVSLCSHSEAISMSFHLEILIGWTLKDGFYRYSALW